MTEHLYPQVHVVCTTSKSDIAHAITTTSGFTEIARCASHFTSNDMLTDPSFMMSAEMVGEVGVRLHHMVAVVDTPFVSIE